MNKKNLTILSLCFILIALFVSCSNKTQDKGTPITDLPCLTPYGKEDSVLYKYMWANPNGVNEPFKVYYSRLNEIHSAFYNKIGFSLHFKQYTGYLLQHLIIRTKYPGGLAEQGASLDSFTAIYNYYKPDPFYSNDSIPYHYFICGIDSLRYDNNPDGMGISTWTPGVNAQRNWSYTKTGKILNRLYNTNSHQVFVEATTLHELGHQIGGIHGHNEASHGGENDDCCVMEDLYYPPTFDCRRTSFIFCDNHLCSAYAETQIGKVFKGNQASNSINFYSNNFKVTIELNKYTYIEAEPMVLTIRFKNNSNLTDSISIYDFEEIESRLGVENEKNEQPKIRFLHAEYLRPQFVKFNSNEEKIVRFELQNRMGYVVLEQTLYGRLFVINKGRYKIIYGSPRNLISNQLTFEVLENENKTLYNKFITTMEMDERYGHFNLDLIGKKALAFKEIFDNYPESPYSDESYYRYFLCYANVEPNFDFVKGHMEFTYKYPNSYYLDKILWYVASKTYSINKNDYDVETIFNKIKNDLPNTYAQELSQTILLKQDYKK